MTIVDAQIHIWAKGTPSAHHSQEPYSKDQALAGMAAEGGDRAVIHPPMWDPVLALAKHSNIAVKATGQAGYALDEYPFRSIHPRLRQVYDAFGPQRMFWGTDITRMPCSWRQCVTLSTEELPWLTGRDLGPVMGRAFCDWIGWKLPEY